MYPVTKTAPYIRPYIVSLSAGFVDYFRNTYGYSFPAKYQVNNTTGFAPMSIKIEYGLWERSSMAMNIYYDNFTYNFTHFDTGNNKVFSRYPSSNFRLFGIGVTYNYYLGKFIHIKHMETFLSVGLSLNNVQHSAYPQGDTTASRTEHIVSPILKVGGRYFLAPKSGVSLFFDLGFDRQSVFDVGFSCSIQRKLKS